MAEIVLDKIEAARRHLVVAIRMFFCESDEVVTHTIASAAAQVTADLLVHKSGFSVMRKKSPWIVPEKQSEVSGAIKKAENFFKHANHDPEGQLSFETGTTPFVLTGAVLEYQQLTGGSFQEADVFLAWFIIQYPDVIDEPERSRLMKLYEESGFGSASKKDLCTALSAGSA